jgi:hypothetical protein
MRTGRVHKQIRKMTKMLNYILLKTGLKDIYFYLYIWMFIRKNKDAEMWRTFNLRHDWIGRIYTVQSYNPEDASLPNEVQYAIVTDKLRPLIDWLQENNLGEIVMPDIKKIPNTYSYLVKFSPLFYEISISWLLIRVTILYLLYTVYPYIKNFIENATAR